MQALPWLEEVFFILQAKVFGSSVIINDPVFTIATHTLYEHAELRPWNETPSQDGPGNSATHFNQLLQNKRNLVLFLDSY